MKKLLPILPILVLFFIGCSYDEPNGYLCGDPDPCSYEGVEECCAECDEDGAYLRGCHACAGKYCEECPECPTCPECPPPEKLYFCKKKVEVCKKWGSDCQFEWHWLQCSYEDLNNH